MRETVYPLLNEVLSITAQESRMDSTPHVRLPLLNEVLSITAQESVDFPDCFLPFGGSSMKS